MLRTQKQSLTHRRRLGEHGLNDQLKEADQSAGTMRVHVEVHSFTEAVPLSRDTVSVYNTRAGTDKRFTPTLQQPTQTYTLTNQEDVSGRKPDTCTR